MAESFRDFEYRGWEDRAVCARYDDYFARLTTQSIGALLDAARVSSSDSVLDVATGPGYVAGAAAFRAARVVGVDFSAQQLELARSRYPGITFQQGDAGDLPFDSASFDVVVSNFGMPHFPDPQRFLQEAFRVLRNAGRLRSQSGMSLRKPKASERCTRQSNAMVPSTSGCRLARTSFSLATLGSVSRVWRVPASRQSPSRRSRRSGNYPVPTISSRPFSTLRFEPPPR
jgi:ubiquinone/menaquinone biosynthesis C-methylase UbiE